MPSSQEIIDIFQKKYPAVDQREAKYLDFCLILLTRDAELSTFVREKLASLLSRIERAAFPVSEKSRIIIWALLIGVMTETAQKWNEKYGQPKTPLWTLPLITSVENVRRFPEISEVI